MFNTSSLELPIVCIKNNQTRNIQAKYFLRKNYTKEQKKKNENKQLNTYNL